MGPMIEQANNFEAADGTMLFERSWQRHGVEPSATVAILHGGAEHSGRYGHTAERLTAAGYAVAAFDQRSHGHSERLRGVPFQIASFDDLLDDTEGWLAGLRTPSPKRPLFVIAHSMGALIAVTLAARQRLRVDGLITSGAALRVMAPAALQRAAQLAANDPDLIVVPLPRDGFDASTRDPAMKAAILADPVHADVTGVPAAFLAEVARITAEVATELDGVTVPLLAMHGTADTMADPSASIELVERAAGTDKTLLLIPSASHALLRDTDRAATETAVIAWIDHRLPAPKPA